MSSLSSSSSSQEEEEEEEEEEQKKVAKEKGGVVFDRELHVQFFYEMLHQLPSEYQSQDVNRLTLAYFSVSGLCILNALHLVEEKEIIEWIYGLQVLPLSSSASEEGAIYGFRGSPSLNIKSNSVGVTNVLHDGGHLAMTYSALATLKILGDDLKRVRREAILSSMRMLQQPDGSFCCVGMGSEADLRFVFCAAAICSLLQDWSGMDSSSAVEYIKSSQSYDQGFGLSPGLESHGGATYCAIAALKLMGQLALDPSTREITSPVIDVRALIKWCSQKQAQAGGFRGRINKDADSCYAFWIGGSLQMLGALKFCDRTALRSFLLDCQSKYGGFSKYPHGFPDIFHAYCGVCGFSLLEEPGLDPLCCELGIAVRALYPIS